MEKALNNELLVKALEIYENKRLGEYEEKAFTPSRDFEKKMENLIKSETSYFRKATRTPKRKVLAAVVAAAVIMTSALSVTAIRESILGFFISRDSQVDVIEYGKNSAKSPDTLEKLYALSYVPEGYKLEDKSKTAEAYEQYFTKGESYIDFQQFTKKSYSSASDSEFSAVKKIEKNGVSYIIRTYEDMTMLVWEKDGYVFELTGFEKDDEMFKIAASVKTAGEGEE